jgi:hypothetical protein
MKFDQQKVGELDQDDFYMVLTDVMAIFSERYDLSDEQIDL